MDIMRKNFTRIDNNKVISQFSNKFDKGSSEELSNIFENALKGEILEEGNIVNGKVISLQGDFAIVSINYKSDGYIPVSEFDGENIEVGSTVKVYLDKLETRDGILLSRTKAIKSELWDVINEKHIAGEYLEGEVLYKTQSGFVVNLDGGVLAFLPNSHADVKPIKDLSTFLGHRFVFSILNIDVAKRTILVSRKKVLMSQHRGLRDEFISTLSVGQEIEAAVWNITGYGAFLRLFDSPVFGGIDGLLHITDMTWGKTTHPSAMFEKDQKVKVVILNIDIDEAGNHKISLGRKQLTPDPWQNIETKFQLGKEYEANVEDTLAYGIVASLDVGIEGLVHNSELSWYKGRTLYTKGQKINVIILSIDKERRRIALSIKQCSDNPWEKFLSTNSLGSVIKCKISGVSDSGVYALIGDKMEAFINMQDVSWDNLDNNKAKLKTQIGTEVEAKIIRANAKRGRIFLGLKQVTNDPFENFLSKVNVGDEIEGQMLKIEEDGYFVRLENQLDLFLSRDELSNFNQYGLSKSLRLRVANKSNYKLNLEAL